MKEACEAPKEGREGGGAAAAETDETRAGGSPPPQMLTENRVPDGDVRDGCFPAGGRNRTMKT